ncbi:MAG: phosphate-starvation-inducible PsiE family protein [Cyclobacteriaceae bacterium]|nr:phosphate-starvation-inducible PsiE family protein [Cyclobacteriaceae bacterium]
MEIINTITKRVIQVLIVLITFMLLYSLVEFIFLLGRSALTHHAAFNFSPGPIERSKVFFGQVQGLIAAILLLTILIELISSLVEYLKVGSANYVTVITEIALIAIVRHLLAIDFEHASAGVLLGLSALIFVLGLFYLLTKKPGSLLGRILKNNSEGDGS